MAGRPGREHSDVDRSFIDQVAGIVHHHHVAFGQIADGLPGLTSLLDKGDREAFARYVIRRQLGGDRVEVHHGELPENRSVHDRGGAGADPQSCAPGDRK